MPKFNIRITDAQRQIIHLSKENPRSHFSYEVGRLLLKYECEFKTREDILSLLNEKDVEGSVFTCLRLSAEAFDAIKRVELLTECKPTQIIKAAIYKRKLELQQNNPYTEIVGEIRKKMQEIELLLTKLEQMKK